ncbi:MAG: PAS domain S-box protein [Candidatus Bathyarchaeota archaeon]|nr:PAS domain S-box protein [Candidatus Bathyarchaeota archaeon]
MKWWIRAKLKHRMLQILHVDDDKVFLEISKAILESEGNFKVDSAVSADEALQKLSEQKYDAVIADYDMPDKDGLQFLQEIRQRYGDLPFVMFTGKGREEIAVRALNLGADGYCNKQGKPEVVYGELAHMIRLAVERAEALYTLAESEKRYRAILEHAAEAVFVHDLSGNLIDVNQQACKNLGYTKEELLALHISDVDPAAPKLGAVFWPKTLAGEAVTFESLHRRKDGSVFPVEVNMTTIKLGEQTAIVGLVKDISERKKVEDAIKSERDMLGRIVASLGAGLVLISKDYHVLWANDLIRRYRGAVEGKLCYTVLNDLNAPCPDCGVTKIFAGQTATDIHEYNSTTIDGKPYWVEIIATPIKDETGQIVAAAEVAVDITERKKIEENVKLSERRWATTLSSIGDAVIATDKEGKITFMNPVAESLTGWSNAEAESKPLSQVFHIINEETRKIVENPVARVLKEGTVVGLANHTLLINRHGKEIPISDSGAPIRDDTGKITGVILVFRDVTERRKIRKELESFARFPLENTAPVLRLSNEGKVLYANPASHKLLKVPLITGCLAPVQWSTYVATALSSKEALTFEEKHGDRVFQFWVVPVVAEGYINLYAVDITDLKKMEHQLATYGRLQAAVAELGQFALTQISEDEFLSKVVNVVAKALEVDFCKILELLPNKKALLLRAGFGWKEGLVGTATVSTGQNSQAGYTLLSGSPVIVENLHTETRFSGPQLLFDHNVVSGLSVIIGNPANPYGVMGAHTTKLRHFNQDEVNFLQSVANLVANFINLKIVETATRQSETKYRTLYETVSGGVVIQNRTGEIVQANTAACEILGLTLDQMIGRASMDPRWHAINEDGSPFPGEDHPAMVTLRTGKPLRKVVMGVYHPKDEARRWIQINSDPLFDADGELTGVMTTFVDITEQKNSQQKLQDSEKKYYSLFYAMNEGVCLHEVIYDNAGKAVDYKILDANIAYEKITGIKREDAIGKRASILYRTTSAPYLDIYSRVAETGEPTSFTTYFAPMDKYFHISVFSPAKGKFATVFADVTENKKQEMLLRENNKKFELLFSKNPEAVVLVDANFLVKEVNTAFTKLFGFSQKELIGTFLPNLVVPERLKTESQRIIEKAKKEITYVETVRKRKDGAEIPVLVSVEPIYEQAKFAGFVVVYKDISDIANARAALEKALQETRRLNEKLAVVGSLTRHDVRNKLAGILGCTYLLKNKFALNADAVQYIEKIESFVHQAERLFDFSHAYQKMGMEQLRGVNVEACFNEAKDLFPEIDKIELLNECAGIEVKADSLLRQLFYNLIDNSLRHGKKVSKIHLHCKKTKDHLQLIYEDNGVGIANNKKSHIFSENLKAENTKGYGLFTIRKLLDVYGWSIEENGAPGEGARFVITIPKDKVLSGKKE